MTMSEDDPEQTEYFGDTHLEDVHRFVTHAEEVLQEKSRLIGQSIAVPGEREDD